ncbi:TRAP transporter small permease [Amphritea pacifica]|uniref:TRAP transporter small permease protein n=1 Tax=Amphritea pacifica TaxID=2811233 RepID=A0ABS2WBZ6_9GAMM|nr:TRAP transporter small permease [Amphritea pacifica]MBN0989245.1 TRAP transporter small permease [Amphritea pacifica]MBN1007283.1 TRAP transporter small permease [Amphritea pacifica]
MLFCTWVSTHYEEQGPVKWLAFALEMIAATTLFLLMLLTCSDVVGRYFLSNSIDGTTELTEIALAILIFAEMPVITWRGGHVVVDILDRMMGRTVIKLLGLFSVFLIASSLYFIATQIYFLAERSFRRSEVTEFLQLPVGLIVEYIAFMSWITAATLLSYGVYRLLWRSRD